MALRGRSMVPSTASRVLIRVEAYEDGRMAGVLYNPYLKQSVRFSDVIDFTNRLDEMFDSLSFPQAAMQYRSFKDGAHRPAASWPDVGTEKREEGAGMAEADRLAGTESDVFIVHVQFRQNATWQGTVKWAGQGRELRFRSTLELLKVMDSALTANHPEDNGT